jgi:hypothetical protein
MSFEFTDEDVEIAMQKMVRAKWQRIFNAQQEGKRRELARKSAQRFMGGSHEQLGVHVGSVPMEEFYKLRKQYGNEAFNDKDFVGWMNKKILHPNGMAATKM